MRSKFKDEHPFGQSTISIFLSLVPYTFLEKRKAEAERIRQKYPDRIPVSVSYMLSVHSFLTPGCGSTSAGYLRESGSYGHPNHRQEEIFSSVCV
jgi:hypothetical protein